MLNSSSPATQKWTRFLQRLSNLDSSFAFLTEALNSVAPTRVKNAAIIKAFEMTFELSWKTLKDLLEYNGVNTTSPREVIKEAFRAGYVLDGQAWIDLLDHRNQLTQVYDESQSSKSAQEIKTIALPQLDVLVKLLKNIAADPR